MQQSAASPLVPNESETQYASPSRSEMKNVAAPGADANKKKYMSVKKISEHTRQ